MSLTEELIKKLSRIAGPLRKAIDAGAERIELDVRMSADGALVVMHDQSIERTTGKVEVVDQMDHRRLTSITLSNGEPIPFLIEVLDQLLPKVELNIELKDASKESVDALLSLLEPFRSSWPKLIISSFDPAPLIQIHDQEKKIPLAALWGGDLKWPHFSYSLPNLFMSRINGTALHPSLRVLNTDLMSMATGNHWQVIPYAGMNEEDEGREAIWAWLKTLGVDGFCTNYPRQLKEWLREESEYDRKYT